MQIGVLGVAHLSRRLGEQALPGGGFRERDDVANRFCPREHHHQSIEPERETAVRWGAVLERLHEVTELVLRLFVAQTDGAEDFFLHVSTINTQRSTANFHAVIHQIIRDRARTG